MEENRKRRLDRDEALMLWGVALRDPEADATTFARLALRYVQARHDLDGCKGLGDGPDQPTVHRDVKDGTFLVLWTEEDP